MNVQQAQQALRQAQLELEQSQRQELLAKLKEVAAQGREIKKAFDDTLRAAKRAIDAEDLATAKFVNIKNAIAEHHGVRPNPSDFPSDEELAAWRSRLQELTKAEEEIASRMRECRSEAARLRLLAIKTEAALATVRRQHSQLEALTSGQQIASGWQGGIATIA